MPVRRISRVALGTWLALTTTLLGVAGAGAAGLIGVMHTDGTHQSVYPINASTDRPGGIAAGADGDIWFTQLAAGLIGKISPSGTIAEYPVPKLPVGPEGIAAGPDGNMWFTESAIGKVAKIDPAGNVTEYPLSSGSSRPTGIAAGPDGAMWVTDHGVDEIDRVLPGSGLALPPYGMQSGSGPWGITPGPDGGVWFTEESGNRIGNISAMACAPLGSSPSVFRALPAPAEQCFITPAGVTKVHM